MRSGKNINFPVAIELLIGAALQEVEKLKGHTI